MDARGMFGEYEKSVRVLEAQPRETLTKAPSTRIRIFFNPQLVLSGYGFHPHAHPANLDIFKSALLEKERVNL